MTGRLTFIEADVSLAWAWQDKLGPLQRTPDLVPHFASPTSPIDYGRLPLETLAVNALGRCTPSLSRGRPGAEC